MDIKIGDTVRFDGELANTYPGNHTVTDVTSEYVYIDGDVRSGHAGWDRSAFKHSDTEIDLSALPALIQKIGKDVGALCAEKNVSYGSSFEKTADFLRILYPDGIKPEQYGDLGILFRIFDKQMRIATRKDAFGESPYRDIAGYGILGAAKDEKKP